MNIKNKYPRWLRHTSLGMAAIFFYAQVASAAIEPANRFWEERRKAAEKMILEDGEKESNRGKEALPARVEAPQAQNALLAQLPSLQLNVLSNSVPKIQDFNQSSIASSLSESDKKGIGSVKVLPTWVKNVPASYANLKEIYIPEGWRANDFMVLHIQDAHENFEAQKNIARIIESLAARPNLKNENQNLEKGLSLDASSHPNPPSRYSPLLVGLEGARGAFNFAPYRSFPDKGIVKEVADYLLKEALISGPEYVGYTIGLEELESKSAKVTIPTYQPPLLFWGVEDESLYLRHVQAFKDSVPLEKEAFKIYDQFSQSVNGMKGKIFNSDLKDLDARMAQHHKGEIKLGAYLSFLTKDGIPQDLSMVRAFVNALKLEESMNYDLVEKERRELTARLSADLSKAELKNLVTASISYRLGNISYGAFYGYLKDLCSAYGVSLGNWKEFDRYVRYVMLSDSIHSEDLFVEVSKLEKRKIKSLAVTTEEKSLVEISQDMILMDKLVRFQLSPEDWNNYQNRKDEMTRLGDRIAKLSLIAEKPALAMVAPEIVIDPEVAEIGHGDVKTARIHGGQEAGQAAVSPIDENVFRPFEDFNKAAIDRNRVLVENLLKKESSTRKERAGRDSNIAVLVAGGFHTEGMTEILREKKVAYAVLTPRLGKIEGKGTDYLEIFRRDKTPLEKLFTGERITLKSPDPLAQNPMLSDMSKKVVDGASHLWMISLFSRKKAKGVTSLGKEDIEEIKDNDNWSSKNRSGERSDTLKEQRVDNVKEEIKDGKRTITLEVAQVPMVGEERNLKETIAVSGGTNQHKEDQSAGILDIPELGMKVFEDEPTWEVTRRINNYLHQFFENERVTEKMDEIEEMARARVTGPAHGHTQSLNRIDKIIIEWIAPYGKTAIIGVLFFALAPIVESIFPGLSMGLIVPLTMVPVKSVTRSDQLKVAIALLESQIKTYEELVSQLNKRSESKSVNLRIQSALRYLVILYEIREIIFVNELGLRNEILAQLNHLLLLKEIQNRRSKGVEPAVEDIIKTVLKAVVKKKSNISKTLKVLGNQIKEGTLESKIAELDKLQARLKEFLPQRGDIEVERKTLADPLMGPFFAGFVLTIPMLLKGSFAASPFIHLGIDIFSALGGIVGLTIPIVGLISLIRYLREKRGIVHKKGNRISMFITIPAYTFLIAAMVFAPALGGPAAAVGIGALGTIGGVLTTSISLEKVVQTKKRGTGQFAPGGTGRLQPKTRKPAARKSATSPLGMTAQAIPRDVIGTIINKIETKFKSTQRTHWITGFVVLLSKMIKEEKVADGNILRGTSFKFVMEMLDSIEKGSIKTNAPPKWKIFEGLKHESMIEDIAVQAISSVESSDTVPVILKYGRSLFVDPNRPNEFKESVSKDDLLDNIKFYNLNPERPDLNEWITLRGLLVQQQQNYLVDNNINGGLLNLQGTRKKEEAARRAEATLKKVAGSTMNLAIIAMTLFLSLASPVFAADSSYLSFTEPLMGPVGILVVVLAIFGLKDILKIQKSVKIEKNPVKLDFAYAFRTWAIVPLIREGDIKQPLPGPTRNDDLEALGKAAVREYEQIDERMRFKLIGVTENEIKELIALIAQVGKKSDYGYVKQILSIAHNVSEAAFEIKGANGKTLKMNDNGNEVGVDSLRIALQIVKGIILKLRNTKIKNLGGMRLSQDILSELKRITNKEETTQNKSRAIEEWLGYAKRAATKNLEPVPSRGRERKLAPAPAMVKSMAVTLGAVIALVGVLSTIVIVASGLPAGAVTSFMPLGGVSALDGFGQFINRFGIQIGFSIVATVGGKKVGKGLLALNKKDRGAVPKEKIVTPAPVSVTLPSSTIVPGTRVEVSANSRSVASFANGRQFYTGERYATGALGIWRLGFLKKLGVGVVGAAVIETILIAAFGTGLGTFLIPNSDLSYLSIVALTVPIFHLLLWGLHYLTGVIQPDGTVVKGDTMLSFQAATIASTSLLGVPLIVMGLLSPEWIGLIFVGLVLSGVHVLINFYQKYKSREQIKEEEQRGESLPRFILAVSGVLMLVGSISIAFTASPAIAFPLFLSGGYMLSMNSLIGLEVTGIVPVSEEVVQSIAVAPAPVLPVSPRVPSAMPLAPRDLTNAEIDQLNSILNGTAPSAAQEVLTAPAVTASANDGGVLQDRVSTIGDIGTAVEKFVSAWMDPSWAGIDPAKIIEALRDLRNDRKVKGELGNKGRIESLIELNKAINGASHNPAEAQKIFEDLQRILPQRYESVSSHHAAVREAVQALDQVLAVLGVDKAVRKYKLIEFARSLGQHASGAKDVAKDTEWIKKVASHLTQLAHRATTSNIQNETQRAIVLTTLNRIVGDRLTHLLRLGGAASVSGFAAGTFLKSYQEAQNFMDKMGVNSLTKLGWITFLTLASVDAAVREAHLIFTNPLKWWNRHDEKPYFVAAFMIFGLVSPFILSPLGINFDFLSELTLQQMTIVNLVAGFILTIPAHGVGNLLAHLGNWMVRISQEQILKLQLMAEIRGGKVSPQMEQKLKEIMDELKMAQGVPELLPKTVLLLHQFEENARDREQYEKIFRIASAMKRLQHAYLFVSMKNTGKKIKLTPDQFKLLPYLSVEEMGQVELDYEEIFKEIRQLLQSAQVGGDSVELRKANDLLSLVSVEMFRFGAAQAVREGKTREEQNVAFEQLYGKYQELLNEFKENMDFTEQTREKAKTSWGSALEKAIKESEESEKRYRPVVVPFEETPLIGADADSAGLELFNKEGRTRRSLSELANRIKMYAEVGRTNRKIGLLGDWSDQEKIQLQKELLRDYGVTQEMFDSVFVGQVINQATGAVSVVNGRLEVDMDNLIKLFSGKAKLNPSSIDIFTEVMIKVKRGKSPVTVRVLLIALSIVIDVTDHMALAEQMRETFALSK